jgi:hypothetical protein
VTDVPMPREERVMWIRWSLDVVGALKARSYSRMLRKRGVKAMAAEVWLDQGQEAVHVKTGVDVMEIINTSRCPY